MPGKDWSDRASASCCLQPGYSFDSHQSPSPIPGGGLLVYPVVGHSHVPWTERPSGGDTPRGRRPEGSSSAVDVAASGCGASGGLWAGDGLLVRVSTRRLLPLGHGFATIWPVGRCCPAVPEQFSAPGLRRRACAAIVAVCPCLWSSCVLDAGRSARTKLWGVLEGPQSWPPRAPRRSPQ